MKSAFRALAVCLVGAAALFADARIRIIHASPDAPKVDILLGASGGPAPQVAVEALPFGQYTNYISIPAGTYNVAVNVSGTSTQVVALPLTVEDGKSYTVLATGFVTPGRNPDFRISVVPETRGPNEFPPDGQAFVRFIHAAPSVPAVDVYALTVAYGTARSSDPLVSGLPFGVATGYARVPSGTYFGRLTPAGSKTIAADVGRITLPSMSVTTIVALDNGFLMLQD